MLLEQEQRLLGFFVEEAKDHLQTIEAGLLHLPQTLQQPAMVHEIFRAAHSLKGGAAMLGISSIQHTAHQFEDYFKILQEQPHLPVDTKLESLLLRLLDILQALVQQLASQSGLTGAVADELMAQAQPLCTQLHEHLQTLAPAQSQAQVVSMFPMFQNYVVQQLRQMLQLFKQAETPETRQQLQECCQKLWRLGQKFNLTAWCNLCQTAAKAIANRENTYRTLAPIVIKELKQSQELVLAGQAAQIKTSMQLQSLCRR